LARLEKLDEQRIFWTAPGTVMIKIKIPYLCGPYVNDVEKWAEAPLPQPIMELKELAIDEVRYQLWKDSLKAGRTRRKAVAHPR
jgi:hypothetical protein